METESGSEGPKRGRRQQSGCPRIWFRRRKIFNGKCRGQAFDRECRGSAIDRQRQIAAFGKQRERAFFWWIRWTAFDLAIFGRKKLCVGWRTLLRWQRL
jgi:hypothetical protein